MTWSAYVLDPRTKSSPPVEAPIPDDASIEQLRCHTRNAIENARASLTIATEDREKAKILTERLDKAVRETCPEASSSDTRQRTHHCCGIGGSRSRGPVLLISEGFPEEEAKNSGCPSGAISASCCSANSTLEATAECRRNYGRYFLTNRREVCPALETTAEGRGSSSQGHTRTKSTRAKGASK